jgi:very-short-patch-repair endonuclease
VLPYNRNLKKFSRELRSNQTEAETFLWLKLRKRQLKNYRFYRQRIICNYIVDFYCPDAQLVIEIDGGQHYSELGMVKDAERDCHLSDLGLTVLRFSARDIFENTEGVLERIYERLPNPPCPPFRKGGNFAEEI